MRIDLNSDLGESSPGRIVGDDAAMLEIVSSANVACGFHAGDASTARAVCRIAAARGVSVGAHVSYRDFDGFGRRFLDVDADVLTDEIVYQVGALQAIAAAEGVSVDYVKPHGALYNAIVHHEAHAAAVVAGVRAVSEALPIVGLAGSAVFRAADRAGLRTVAEAFADRAYAPDATLVPRSSPGAVLHDPAAIAARVVGMVVTGTVEAIDGSIIAVQPESVCVHGDTAGAVAITRSVRDALAARSIEIAPFAARHG